MDAKVGYEHGHGAVDSAKIYRRTEKLMQKRGISKCIKQIMKEFGLDEKEANRYIHKVLETGDYGMMMAYPDKVYKKSTLIKQLMMPPNPEVREELKRKVELARKFILEERTMTEKEDKKE